MLDLTRFFQCFKRLSEAPSMNLSRNIGYPSVRGRASLWYENHVRKLKNNQTVESLNIQYLNVFVVQEICSAKRLRDVDD